MLQQLLGNSTYAKVQSSCGETLLYWATSSEMGKSVEALVKAGARIDGQVLCRPKMRIIRHFISYYCYVLQTLD